jgi:hypothetical protein
MGIRRRIKGDWGSFPCIQNIMILYWMWIGEFYLRKSVYVTLEKEEEIMQVGCTFIIAMKNG